jgi:hypothetical protein
VTSARARPNRHVLISGRTALGIQPISKGYFHFHLRRHGVGLDRIRGDRILHEAHIHQQPDTQ